MERADLSRLLGVELAVGEAHDVIVEAREPERFIERFTHGVAAGGRVFLADPGWGARERAQFNALLKQRPDAGREHDGRGWLCIPTGGSSGEMKLARHDEETVSAAVNGFCAHFDVKRVNAVGLLPLHHVSGMMAWLRTVLTGGAYLPWSWKAIEAGERPALPARGEEGAAWFLSVVPTQLQRLLGDSEAEEWLRGFHAIFVGGGPAWPELVEAGAKARLPLAFSYGMTETVAMVTALRPEEFLSGARGCGRALPHGRVVIGANGELSVESASLFRGYWPERRSEGAWQTEDLGRFDERGGLCVLGRRDALIITGGEKVDPAEVELALRADARFRDVAVVGVPDGEWGQAVVACYLASDSGAAALVEAGPPALEALSAFKRPKRYVAFSPAEWPRNEQGKVSRRELVRMLSARF